LVILVLAIFLLSNRDMAALGFWPYAVLVRVPVGAAMLAMLAIGFLLGIAFHLPKRMSATRRAKRAEQKAAAFEQARPPAAP
jgi:uncharacterized integral membrane protein